MKKMSLIFLVCVLPLAAFAGGVYAEGDVHPVTANRLVGVGDLGTLAGPNITIYTVFAFTNPDDVEEITITKVSIIEGNGDLVYDGPYIYVTPDGTYREVKPDPMTPHEIWQIRLQAYMWTGLGIPDDLTDVNNWMSRVDALNKELKAYTVEIEWEAKGAVAPLTGWQRTRRSDGEGVMMYESQMVNMKQRRHK